MFVWIKDTLIVFLALLAPLWIVAGLNYSGFCWEQKRWLSDEEMIRNAVSYFLDFHNRGLSNQIYLDDVYYDTTNLSDSTVDAFLKNNPDCCHISRGEDTFFREALPYTGVGIQLPSIQDSLLGWYRYSVSIRFNQRYIDVNKTVKETERIAFIIMTNCGMKYRQ